MAASVKRCYDYGRVAVGHKYSFGGNADGQGGERQQVAQDGGGVQEGETHLHVISSRPPRATHSTVRTQLSLQRAAHERQPHAAILYLIG